MQVTHEIKIYHSTFPDPVIALPHISRPANANGMHAAYIKHIKGERIKWLSYIGKINNQKISSHCNSVQQGK